MDGSSHVITTKDPNDFAIAVDLNKQPLFHVLWRVSGSSIQMERNHIKSYLLKLGLCLRHIDSGSYVESTGSDWHRGLLSKLRLWKRSRWIRYPQEVPFSEAH